MTLADEACGQNMALSASLDEISTQDSYYAIKHGEFENDLATFIEYSTLNEAIHMKRLLDLCPDSGFIRCKRIIKDDESVLGTTSCYYLVTGYYDCTLSTTLSRRPVIDAEGYLTQEYRFILRSILESSIEAYKRGLVPSLNANHIFIKDGTAVISKFEVIRYVGWITRFPIILSKLMDSIISCCGCPASEVKYWESFKKSLLSANSIYNLRSCLGHPFLMDPMEKFHYPVRIF